MKRVLYNCNTTKTWPSPKMPSQKRSALIRKAAKNLEKLKKSTAQMKQSVDGTTIGCAL